MPQCKKLVFKGYHSSRCSRKATKEGYCTQHHPETIAAKDEQARLRGEEKQASSPMRVAKNRIKLLEEALEKALKIARKHRANWDEEDHEMYQLAIKGEK